jgi:hypothetical protein
MVGVVATDGHRSKHLLHPGEARMIARVNRSDLQLIRLDGNAVRHLPEEVRHAAEVLAAYVAGLEQGRRHLDLPRQQSRSNLRQTPPTDPADVPGRGGDGTPSEVRRQLEELAGTQHADDQASVRRSGSGVESSICTIISGVDVAATPEVVLIWGVDAYRQAADKLT